LFLENAGEGVIRGGSDYHKPEGGGAIPLHFPHHSYTINHFFF